MRRSRFTVAEIRAILREAEAGTSVRAVVRRHGISEATFFRWRRQVEHDGPDALEQSRAAERSIAELRVVVARQQRELEALRSVFLGKR